MAGCLGGSLTDREVCDEAGKWSGWADLPLSERYLKFQALELLVLGHGPLWVCSNAAIRVNPVWCSWGPIINYEGSFIFAGSGQGEETYSFYAATSLLCEKHNRNAFSFTLMSYRESLTCSRQRGRDSRNMNLWDWTCCSRDFNKNAATTFHQLSRYHLLSL